MRQLIEDGRCTLFSALLAFALVHIAGFAAAQARDQAAEDTQPAGVGWKIKFDESGSNPVIVDGVLYLGSEDGAIHALDPETGESKWRLQTGESIPDGPHVITVARGTSIAGQMAAATNAIEELTARGIRRVDMTAAVGDATVFIGSGDLSFYAIDAATGQKKWSYQAGPGMAAMNNISRPVPAALLNNGVVYFVTEQGLHALDSLTGKAKWLFETLQESSVPTHKPTKRQPSEPVLGDGVLFLTAWPYASGSSLKGSFVYAVDADSGKAKWVTGLDGSDISAAAAAAGLVFVAAALPEHRVALYAIDAIAGQVKWHSDAERMYRSTLLVANDMLYFCTDKQLLALELRTGRELWSFRADELMPDLQVDVEHLYLVAGDSGGKGMLYQLDLTTGQKKWSRPLNGGIEMVQEGVVYATDGRVRAIDAATGKELWSFKGTGRESVRLVSGGRVFLTSPTVTYFGTDQVTQGYLYAIDAKTGKLDSR